MRLKDRKNRELILGIFLVFLIFFVFRSWFSFGLITAGDWGFAYPETLRFSTLIPSSWSSLRSLGVNSLSTLWLESYCRLTAFIFNQIFKIPWFVAEKLIWPWVFLILTIFSSWYLVKTLFPKSRPIQFFTPFIYLFNVYILMVVGGGQIGIGLAYSLAPFVFGLFINLINGYMDRWIDGLMVRSSILTGAVLAIQVMFDPRIAYITMGAVILYFVFCIKYLVLREDDTAKALFPMLFSLIVPIVIAVLLHFYWLLPVILVRKPVLPAGFGKPRWVEFLSFGNFSDSISLLHPNWPENIFGKTYFMRPEFLVIPMLAFISLLFIKGLKDLRARKDILFFASLALIGAFLAKGSKPPFGEVYLWLFKHFPGMSMFRDPTKFYPLVALSYSILIPFSVSEIYTLLSSKFKITVQSSKLQFKVQNYLPGIFLLLVTVYWLLLIKPAILGQLGGTFKTKVLPTEYTVLKDFIHSQEEFFRTFWIPQRQRFGFYSNNHPALNADSFVSENNCQQPLCSLKEKMPEKWGKDCLPNDRCYVRELSYFLNPQTAQIFSEMAIKYVIVPSDSEGEIFLGDRKYNQQQKKEVEKFLDTSPWLKKINLTEKIAVYETLNYQDRFFVVDGEIPSMDWTMVNPTKYLVPISEATQPFELVFSETYDELWQAKIENEVIPSEKRYNILNSFTIGQTGDFDIVVEFAAQRYVYYGLVVSAATLLAVFGALAYHWRKR